MKDTLSKDLGRIILHLLIPVGIGRKPVESKRSSKEDLKSLKIGSGKGNQITRWQKGMLANGHPTQRCPGQRLFGQDQTYQGMHLSHGSLSITDYQPRRDWQNFSLI